MQNPSFKATLLLFLAILFSYFFLSKGELFIPAETLAALSFSSVKPLNFLSFIFIHVGLVHLLVNLLSLASFGWIVEKKLFARDVFGIFFLSAIISGIVFIAVNPSTGLIGASAGVSGLIASALFLKPKQAAIGIVFVLLSGSIAFFIATGGLEKILQEKEKEIAQAKQEIQKAIEEKKIEKAEQLEKALESRQIEVVKIKTGLTIQQLTPTDALVHAIGALAGIGYLRVFRKKEFFEAGTGYAELFKKIGL